MLTNGSLPHHYRLVALALVLTACAGSKEAQRQDTAAPSTAAGTSITDSVSISANERTPNQQGDPSKVTFVNQDWDYVRVQVVEGNSANCDQKDAKADFSLKRGGEKPVDAFDDLCYRRLNDPANPNSGWRDWVTRPVFPPNAYRERVR